MRLIEHLPETPETSFDSDEADADTLIVTHDIEQPEIV